MTFFLFNHKIFYLLSVNIRPSLWAVVIFTQGLEHNKPLKGLGIPSILKTG